MIIPRRGDTRESAGLLLTGVLITEKCDHEMLAKFACKLYRAIFDMHGICSFSMTKG